MVSERGAAKEKVTPKFPIYVISKGRWESRLTVKALEKMKVPFKLVVEDVEFDDYAKVVDPIKLIRLPFSNLGLGSTPARNFVWDHAIANRAERHWILDDNINGFCLWHGKGQRTACTDGAPFVCVENFVERYVNVALAGLQYRTFGVPPVGKSYAAPFIANTRIYSCILILNKLSHRWRGRYNEDTDLSIRVLKAGWATVLVNMYLCNKVGTMMMRGGNTDELYDGQGRLEMAQSLQRQHPKLVKIAKRWGRWQHVVDYRPFKTNKLIRA